MLNARITEQIPGGDIIPTEQDVEENEQPKLRLFYLSGGLSKTVNNASLSTFSGQGYRVGLGVSQQLKNSWHLGAELNMVHEPFSDTALIKGKPTYGFTRGENEYVVHTTQLMYAEMPLMIGYRFKRISVNTGASIGYMLGLKNETLSSLKYNATTIDQSTESGYYRWDRYRSLHLGGLVDAQYQLTAAVPNAFVGIRYTYGITELLTIEQRNVRKSRIEVYLKMTLK